MSKYITQRISTQNSYKQAYSNSILTIFNFIILFSTTLSFFNVLHVRTSFWIDKILFRIFSTIKSLCFLTFDIFLNDRLLLQFQRAIFSTILQKIVSKPLSTTQKKQNTYFSYFTPKKLLDQHANEIILLPDYSGNVNFDNFIHTTQYFIALLNYRAHTSTIKFLILKWLLSYMLNFLRVFL